jgi:hypothetical protein
LLRRISPKVAHRGKFIAMHQSVAIGATADICAQRRTARKRARRDDSARMSIGDTLRSILTRVVAYLAVVIAAGLLFLAGTTVYELMWPRPVVPLSQMSNSP